MSDRFRIHKTDNPVMPWAMDYPAGFSDGPIGEACGSFDNAVAVFIKASEQQCPMCLRGAVVTTSWGWKCQNCGNYDVAVGMRGASMTRDALIKILADEHRYQYDDDAAVDFCSCRERGFGSYQEWAEHVADLILLGFAT